MLRNMLSIGALSLAQSAAFAANPADIPTGIFSNEEQVYFATENNLPRPALIYVRIASDGGEGPLVTGIDAFGAAKPLSPEMAREIASALPGVRFDSAGFTVRSGNGLPIELRRARPVTCWSAIPKSTKKPDGSEDWYFAQGVKIHDQGGRALIGKDEADVKPLVIRMRNVVWPPKPDGSANSNRPSLVLYIHNPDEPDKALSYVWADPGAARIGINLRWMQASCTVDGKE